MFWLTEHHSFARAWLTSVLILQDLHSFQTPFYSKPCNGYHSYPLVIYFPSLWKNKSLEKHEDEQEGTSMERVYFQSHAVLLTVKDTADCGLHTYRLCCPLSRVLSPSLDFHVWSISMSVHVHVFSCMHTHAHMEARDWWWISPLLLITSFFGESFSMNPEFTNLSRLVD